jgi:hypothetical protein
LKEVEGRSLKKVSDVLNSSTGFATTHWLFDPGKVIQVVDFVVSKILVSPTLQGWQVH